MISPGVFLMFLKTLIFEVVREVKGQKMVQNVKKFCLLCFIFQEPYIPHKKILTDINQCLTDPANQCLTDV